MRISTSDRRGLQCNAFMTDNNYNNYNNYNRTKIDILPTNLPPWTSEVFKRSSLVLLLQWMEGEAHTINGFLLLLFCYNFVPPLEAFVCLSFFLVGVIVNSVVFFVFFFMSWVYIPGLGQNPRPGL